MRRPLVLGLLLAVLTFAVYLPVGRHAFVNYDDSDYVTANAHVQSGLKWENVAWAFRTGHASNWHPLTWLSHMLDCQWFGEQAGPQHLVSVALHIVNTLLVLVALNRLTGALWRSALVAGLFALHPLHVESVAWISERKDVLSTCFGLLSLLAYASYARRPTPATSRSARRVSRFSFQASPPYLLALVCFACSLMSKSMLVTLPFVLLLLDAWPLKRVELAEADPKVPNPGFKVRVSNWIPLLIEKLPFLALSAASSIVTFLVQRKGGAVSTSLPVGGRVANALVSYVRYLAKTFWPRDLSVLYPHPGHWPAGQVIAAALLLLVVSAAVVVVARRRPYLAVGWLWFLGTLIPVIGLIQVGIQSMADRYTYFPSIGLFILVAWGLAELVPPRPWRPKLLLAGSAAALGLCALLTAKQIGIWRDSETLFRHAVEVTKNNYLAYNNLGFFLSNQGKTAEAMEQYRKSLEIQPAYEDAHNNLGFILAGQKKYAEAIAHYEVALRIRPNHVEVHNNLGNALSEIGKIDEAIAHYRFVLERKPDHADAHNNLGIALAMQGKLDEAIEHFHQAIRFKPNYASAHSNLGNALAAQHRLADAIKEYQESLRLKPDDAQAHNNLGNGLAEQGRVVEAIAHYAEALRLNSDNPEAHFNLGLALLRQGDRTNAVLHFTEALRLKPDYEQARSQLAILGDPHGK